MTSSRTDRSLISAPVCSIPPTAPCATASVGRAAEHRHGARVGREQAEQHVDRGRLARAVGAEQRDRLAGGDRTSMPRTAWIGPSGPAKDLTQAAACRCRSRALTSIAPGVHLRALRIAFSRSTFGSTTLRMRTKLGVASTASSSRTNSSASSSVSLR